MKTLGFQSSLVIVYLQLKRFQFLKRIHISFIYLTEYIKFLNLFDKQEEAELNLLAFQLLLELAP